MTRTDSKRAGFSPLVVVLQRSIELDAFRRLVVLVVQDQPHIGVGPGTLLVASRDVDQQFSTVDGTVVQLVVPEMRQNAAQYRLHEGFEHFWMEFLYVPLAEVELYKDLHVLGGTE